MANFPWIPLGTGAMRWSIVTTANLLHLDHGWKGLWQIGLPRSKTAQIESWGDVLTLFVDLLVDAATQLACALPHNVGIIILIVAWLIETKRLAQELRGLIAMIRAVIAAMLEDETGDG